VYCIVGTSMGALIGGLYCSGYTPEEIHTELSRLTWEELFNDSPNRLDMYTGAKKIADRHLVQVRFDGLRPHWIRSYSSGQKIREILSRLFYKAPLQSPGDYDQLRVPFRAIATDLITGQQVCFRNGDIVEAIRASMSVPLLFSPVAIDSFLLVDGGISSNIPVPAALELGADRILVVDSTSPLRTRDEIHEAWEVADQVIGIMQAGPNRQNLGLADLVIRPDIGHSTLESIDGSDSLVAAGYRALQEQLPTLKALLAKPATPGQELPGWNGRVLKGDARGLEHSIPARSEPLVRDTLDSLLHAACDPGVFRRMTWKLQELQGEDTTRGLVLEVDATRWPDIRSVRHHLRGGLDTEPLSECSAVPGPLSHVQLTAHLDTLLQELRGRGYSLARVDSITVGGDRLDVFLDPGHVSEVRVEGLRHISRRRVLGEFVPRPGGVFRQDQAESRIRRLHASGLFEQVQMGLLREDTRNVVEIHVVERAWPVLRAGLRYSSALEGRGFIELDNERLLAGFLRGTLYYSYGASGESSRVTFESDRVNGSLWTARLELRRDHELFHWRDARLADGLARVEQEQAGGTFSLGRQWPGLGTVYVGVQARRLEEEGERGQRTQHSTGLFLSSVVDSRDRIGLTRKGEYHSVSLTNMLESMGSDATWLQFRTRFDSWRTLGGTTARGTVVYEFADSPPLLETSRMGGGELLATLRPAEWQGAQVAGVGVSLRQAVLDTNLGQWSVGTRWSLVAVNDRSQFQLKRGDLRQEAGLFLALDSPAGPLRAGGSLAIDRQPGDSRWALWTDLGFPFE
jgi:predicted acylesterase/phospholipase RssA